jgi:O-antigen ligase
MEMLMPVPIAMVIARTSRRDIRLLYLFAAAMMALAAVASLSRGGMISLAVEMAFIAGVSAKTKDEGGSRDAQGKSLLSWFSFVLRPAALVLLITAAIVAGVFWMGSERVVDRIAHSSPTGEGQREESFFTSRGWVWRDTLAMIRANPVTGVGIGAYETSYPIYSRDDGAVVLGKSYSVDRAHNDYLQILAECGVVGGALALWFIATIFRAIARGLKSRDPLRRAFAIGGGAGIFGLLVHSLVDFNLQLPSNALLFLLLVAVVSPVGAVSSAARREQERTVLRKAPVAGVATGA